MATQTWVLPALLIVSAILAAIPLSKYLAFIMDSRKSLPLLKSLESSLDSGQQNWKQYGRSLLTFNTVLFVFGFAILALQPYLPLNPDGKTMLAPSTIFNTAASFMTNTDLQHYAGEQQFSNFSQIFFCFTNFFLSAAIGVSVLAAIIRALRGDPSVGNFFVDVWRVVVYLLLPFALVFGLIFLQQGSPMTLQSSYHVTTLEQGTQNIVVGPVAAFEAIKMLGTNGGGFYGMNSAHPFENPTALSNFINTLAMMLFPFALVLMYGRMLNQPRHSYVIFGVMLVMLMGCIYWTVAYDTLQPNPALLSHRAQSYAFAKNVLPDNKLSIDIPAVSALPVDQHLGNLEGKELRFGTAAGATFAALTTDVTCGAVNAETDSLNPLAGLAPMVGMWMNCFFGGKGVGMINMLLYIIIGIFLAGMMVGRTPEYLGKKIGGREVKLTILAMLIHPATILIPTGLFAATAWGLDATTNPGAHGFSQILYQFSSASANNGSAFDGLQANSIFFDITTGVIMIVSRFIPMIALLAMAAFLGAKKSSPVGIGTLRVDTFTFGCLLLGTILIIGGLLFLPAAVLGPIAEHFGPMPFGS